MEWYDYTMSILFADFISSAIFSGDILFLVIIIALYFIYEKMRVAE